MSLLDRIRDFWRSPPDPDHPLSEEERRDVLPSTVPEEAASLEQGFIGLEFDPDEKHRP